MELKDLPEFQQEMVKEEVKRLWNNGQFSREMLEATAKELLKELKEH